MKRGKKVEDDGIQMSGGIAIGDMGDGAYKYFGVLESEKTKMKEMKLKVRQDYYRRIKRVLESSLYRKKNTVKVINT